MPKTLEQLRRDLLERPPFNKGSYRDVEIKEALDAAIAERDDLRAKINAELLDDGSTERA